VVGGPGRGYRTDTVRGTGPLRPVRPEPGSGRETIRIRELAIAREVQQRLSALQLARSERIIAERNFKLASDRARLARRLFERGRGDNFSVTDAEEALQDAENKRLGARAEASISGYELLHGLGMLVEVPADLKPDPRKRPNE
jgi:outer membrane protein TolC